MTVMDDSTTQFAAVVVPFRLGFSACDYTLMLFVCAAAVGVMLKQQMVGLLYCTVK